MCTADLDSVLKDLAAGRLDVAQAMASLNRPKGKPVRTPQPAPRKPASIVTELLPNQYGHNRFQAEIAPGVSIRIFGERDTNTGTRHMRPELVDLWAAVDAGDLQTLDLICDALDDIGYHHAEHCRRVAHNVLVGRPYLYQTETPEQSRAKYLENLRTHCELFTPTLEPFDRTFKVGEMAEHGAYNLSYYGPILRITPKTVVIKSSHCNAGELRTKRFTIDRFAQNNWDWELAKAQKRNSEWSD